MFPKQTETCGRRMNKCEVSRESGGSGKLPIILCISNVLKVGQVMIGGRQGGWHAEMDGHTEMLKGDTTGYSITLIPHPQLCVLIIGPLHS